MNWTYNFNYGETSPVNLGDCMVNLSSTLSPTSMEHVRFLQVEFTDNVAKENTVLKPSEWLKVRHTLPNLKQLVLRVAVKYNTPLVASAYLRIGKGHNPFFEALIRDRLSFWHHSRVGSFDGVKYDWVHVNLTFEGTLYDCIASRGGRESLAEFNKLVSDVWEQHKHQDREAYNTPIKMIAEQE